MLLLQLQGKHNTLLCLKNQNSKQKLYYNNFLHQENEDWIPTEDEYEMFNHHYFQDSSEGEEPATDNDTNRVLYATSTDLKPVESPAEVIQNFISVQTEQDIIPNNIEAEYEKNLKHK